MRQVALVNRIESQMRRCRKCHRQSDLAVCDGCRKLVNVGLCRQIRQAGHGDYRPAWLGAIERQLFKR